jgi:hypothetical protein
VPVRGEIVIGDVHARPVALRSLLRRVGVLDRVGRRDRSWLVVQLGDLLDRRASVEANLETARLAVEAVDVVLAGNHEAEMLAAPGCGRGPSLATPASQGWPHAAAACSTSFANPAISLGDSGLMPLTACGEVLELDAHLLSGQSSMRKPSLSATW